LKTLIVSITYYKKSSEIRFGLAKKFVEKAVAEGYPVVIVDGSPDPVIGQQLQQTGARVFPQLHKGTGACQRQAFFHANEVAMETDSKIIFWSEPEKHDIVRSIEGITKPIKNNMADVIVPRRSNDSWESWPKFQQTTEKLANKAFNNAFGTACFDPMFGPVAFSREHGSTFMTFDAKLFEISDVYIQHFVPMLLLYRGKAVCTIEVEMEYPQEQKAEEEGALKEEMQEKRVHQRDSMIESYKILAKIWRVND
jgi:hypothetical protein